MGHQQAWSRRRFSKAIFFAQCLMASGTLTLPLACTTTKKSNSDPLLNDAQQETLSWAMDELIPSNGIMPSASEIGGIAYILSIMKALPDLSPLFEGLIAHIDEQCQYQFTKIKSAERIAVLKHIEEHQPQLFKVLKEFTYESYYTNETVFPLIGYEPYPTGSKGPEMEPFDDTLLDRVRALKPTYIKI